jgi:hypothetical protein
MSSIRTIVLAPLMMAAGVLSGCGFDEFESSMGASGEEPLSLRGRNDAALRQAAPTTSVNVPKARCGPHDRTETGLQGQTTLAERLSGASLEAYNCNLDLVGQFTGEGAEWQMAWFDDCAYYDTKNMPTQAHPGTAVIDVSDPRHPTATAYLNDPSMAEPWESLKVNRNRKLLAGVQANNGSGLEPGFAIYDVSGDCRQPRLLSSRNLEPPGPTAVRGHAGDFAPDGLTYYGTATGQRTVYPIDISDPTNPKLLAKWAFAETGWSSHDLTISEDGTRLYAAQPGNQVGTTFQNGLVIVDVNDVQRRLANPQPRIISQLFWRDGSVAQNPTQVRIKGRRYILFTDEQGSGGSGPTRVDLACAQGLPPYGFARLIDITDETNPVVVSKLMLEVHDPANCAAVAHDNDTSTAVTGFQFIYDSHYCTVDRPKNARLAACSYFQSGVRVFDIRDPYRPREVAYYKPPGVGAASRPGSAHAQREPGYRDHDWSASNIRFVKAKGERYLWFTSHDNGFQVVKFTNGLKKIADEAHDDDDDEDSHDRDARERHGRD